MSEKRLLKNMIDASSERASLMTTEQGYKFEILEKVVSMGRDQAMKELETSKLRGRGGAAFPTYIKWQSVQGSPDVVLICNADEGEPGTFKDRFIMEKGPFLLLESLLIGAYMLQAKDVFIYIRGEYKMAIESISKSLECVSGALELLKEQMGFQPLFKVVVGAGAYVCGDETSLINSIEGRRPSPRMKPPLPTVSGFMNRPTVVNNVETLANISLIMALGGKEYAKVGTETDTGTKLISLSGKVNNPGVYEVAFGSMTLREIITELGGGIKEGKATKFVIPGGISTQILTAKELDVSYTMEDLNEAGTSLGSGAIIVADETVDVYETAVGIADFFMKETCGTCFPCKEGNRQVYHLLEEMGKGNGKEDYLDLIIRITSTTSLAARCGLGKTTGNFIASSIEKLPEDYLSHIEAKMPVERM